jgi:hypothetical protein
MLVIFPLIIGSTIPHFLIIQVDSKEIKVGTPVTRKLGVYPVSLLHANNLLENDTPTQHILAVSNLTWMVSYYEPKNKFKLVPIDIEEVCNLGL